MGWTFHAHAPDRIPRIRLYGELAGGSRLRGQKLRFKDVIKRHMEAAGIDVSKWEETAQNRQVEKLSGMAWKT